MDPITNLQRALRLADGHSILSLEAQALIAELRDVLRRDEEAAKDAILDTMADDYEPCEVGQ